jgi:ATP-dependent DNA ligase
VLGAALTATTARCYGCPTAVAAIAAKSFTLDGALVVGPDGLSRFEELRRREAAHKAILFAFDLIEHDGEDLRDLPFLARRRWRDCCAISRRASC